MRLRRRYIQPKKGQDHRALLSNPLTPERTSQKACYNIKTYQKINLKHFTRLSDVAHGPLVKIKIDFFMLLHLSLPLYYNCIKLTIYAYSSDQQEKGHQHICHKQGKVFEIFVGKRTKSLRYIFFNNSHCFGHTVIASNVAFNS